METIGNAKGAAGGGCSSNDKEELVVVGEVSVEMKEKGSGERITGECAAVMALSTPELREQVTVSVGSDVDKHWDESRIVGCGAEIEEVKVGTAMLVEG